MAVLDGFFLLRLLGLSGEASGRDPSWPWFCTYKVYLVQRNNFSMGTHVEVPEKVHERGRRMWAGCEKSWYNNFHYDTFYGTKKRSRMTCSSLTCRMGLSKVSTAGEVRSRRSTE